MRQRQIGLRAALLIGALALAGCNSNAIGLNVVGDPGTPWVAYIATFVAGALTCGIGFVLWLVYRINTSE